MPREKPAHSALPGARLGHPGFAPGTQLARETSCGSFPVFAACTLLAMLAGPPDVADMLPFRPSPARARCSKFSIAPARRQRSTLAPANWWSARLRSQPAGFLRRPRPVHGRAGAARPRPSQHDDSRRRAAARSALRAAHRIRGPRPARRAIFRIPARSTIAASWRANRFIGPSRFPPAAKSPFSPGAVARASKPSSSGSAPAR